MPDTLTSTELLRDARRILWGGKWTKDTLARKRDGKATMPWEADACQFCLVGAVARGYFERTGDMEIIPLRSIPVLKDALARLVAAIRHRTGHKYQQKGMALIVGRFNDNSGTFYGDVLAVLTEAAGEGSGGENRAD